MILDVFAGIFEVLNALSVWRFLTCFAPAVALALFLFFCVPGKVVAITLSIIILAAGTVIGTRWEVAALRTKRNPAKVHRS